VKMINQTTETYRSRNKKPPKDKHRLQKEKGIRLTGDVFLNLSKPDIIQDRDFDLIEWLGLERKGTGLFDEGEQAATFVRSAAIAVSNKLEGTERYKDHRDLIRSILAGGSISSYARSRGKSREWISKSLFKRICELIFNELASSK